MDPSPSIPRRRFVKLLAASAASLAMASDPARAAAKTTERHRPATTAPKSTPLDKELRTEKKSVADMLKAVRSYKLPAGSAPAMVFRPMKARRGRAS
ncbi:MAG TPA: hypothetical protein VFX78_12555 [Candidatus Eisenbacteria bacterium]|nr:hypothetical protein [Candidatus Eisenbacteria bacterium]